MKRYISLAVGILVVVAYAFYVYERESVTVVEVVIGAILAILGIIAAYTLSQTRR